MGCAVIGCGNAIPDLEIDNDQMSLLVDTSDEWISSRTGIKTRHVALNESSLDLSEEAARKALGWDDGGYSERSIDPEEIDLVITATLTGDVLVPSNAALLRRKLGLKNAICFDLNAACSGFVYALNVAESMIAASATADNRTPIRHALVVAVERPSRITNWADRNTCVLLGDGAGAVVLEHDPNRAGILSTFLANEDDIHNALTCPAPLDVIPPFNADGVNTAQDIIDESHAAIDEMVEIEESLAEGNPRNVLRMNGQRVFKFSARAMKEAVTEVCRRANVDLNDIALIVPHQANERIIDFGARHMGLSKDLFKLSIERRGNTSAASVPMALADAYNEGQIKKGDKVIVVAFGGGFTIGAALYEV